jgi:uncharacterized protein (TIGR02246 family)
VTSTEAEVEALERRGWEALSRPNGADFYRDVMADDGLMVFPGAVLDKAATLRAIATAEPWSTFALSDLRVVTPTTNAAIVTYEATAQRDASPPYRALMTSVYAHTGGSWRLVLHQQTPSPG